MAELRLTQKDVTVALGVAVPTASQKLNPMDLDEAEKLAALLQLGKESFGEYFSARQLHNATADGAQQRGA